MFNKIIQPTGIYGDFVQKLPEASVQTQTINKQPFIQTTQKQEDKRTKIGIFPKLIAAAFAVITVVWGIPAINKIIIQKEADLSKQEEKLNKKIKILISKGVQAIDGERKSLEKEQKNLNFRKKIFEKINKTPVLKSIKEGFANLSESIELKIQKPFQIFMQKHVFGHIKNKS